MFPKYDPSKLTKDDMETLRYSIQMLHELMADLLNQENWETDYDLCDEIRRKLLEVLKNAKLKQGGGAR